jgi:hypothetical protein
MELELTFRTFPRQKCTLQGSYIYLWHFCNERKYLILSGSQKHVTIILLPMRNELQTEWMEIYFKTWFKWDWGHEKHLFSVKQYILIYGIVWMEMFLCLELLSDLAADIQPKIACLQIYEYYYVEVSVTTMDTYLTVTELIASSYFLLSGIRTGKTWFLARSKHRRQLCCTYILIFTIRM